MAEAPNGGWWRNRASCADPAVLPLVDAAYERPGGPESKYLQETVCSHCPVADLCFAEAMSNGEFGVWGGTSPNFRSRRGSAPTRSQGASGSILSAARYHPVTV